jgi:hypothetical protein
MGWEYGEVFWLELFNEVEIEFGLGSEGRRFTSIITPVSEFFTHKTVRVMSVEGRLCNVLILAEISGPW